MTGNLSSSSRKSPYRRVLIKFSGESFNHSQSKGSSHYQDQDIIHLVQTLKLCVDDHLQICVVLGGGNLIRGKDLRHLKISKTCADSVGMISTLMNGLILADYLKRSHIDYHLVSCLGIDGLLDVFDGGKADQSLSAGKVLIVVGGLGKPYFTTDTAAVLVALQTQCDALFKLTKVDGLYSEDPRANDAIFLEKINYDEVIAKKLEVMDLTAFTLCAQNKLPIHICHLNNQRSVVENKTHRVSGSMIS